MPGFFLRQRQERCFYLVIAGACGEIGIEPESRPFLSSWAKSQDLAYPGHFRLVSQAGIKLGGRFFLTDGKVQCLVNRTPLLYFFSFLRYRYWISKGFLVRVIPL